MTTSKADGTRAKSDYANDDSADDSDWLGYGAYADALWIRTMRALDRDKDGRKELGDDPLVIGIFGEWGAGKSALLKLIHKKAEANLAAQIAARADDAGFSLTVPVGFQPWKYEHEEHLHVPMVVHVLNALKDALKQDPTVVQSLVETSGKAVAIVEKAAPAIAKGAKVARAIFPIAKKILKSISFFGVSIDLPDDLEDWLEAAADAGGAKEKAKDEAAAKVDKSAIGNVPKHVADGSYFYRIHELLGALTRPGTYEKRKSLFDHAELTPQTRINFVIFIDDLDRCLPEKAVQTLELIKTVFNTESFAFVLALDEEVIERGIGHRYQAYNFAGKKPEMPITGFEYLEKIVHLPFKLPALTEKQARHFVERLEEQIAGPENHWFMPLVDANPSGIFKTRIASRKSLTADGGGKFEVIEFDDEPVPVQGKPFDLLALALRGFDAYVPRKLARLVELWHTTVQVAILRNEHDSRKEVLAPSSAAQVDIRIVLTLLMVQIFHPDLYRVFRRHEETFQTLYNGFDSSGDNLSPSLSDIDLWHWAAYKLGERDEGYVRPVHLEAALTMIAKLDDSQRYPAQQKRLPLVECIIAHRKAQRHVFDALKLFSALKQQMPALPAGFKVGQYFSLLAEYDPALTPPRVVPEPPPPNPDATPDSIRRFTPVDAQQLYLSLIAADAGTQAALVEKAQLEPGKFLTKVALDQLIEKVNKWLGEANRGTYVGRSQQAQLLNGLQYLAPYIAKGDGVELWKLVADAVDLSKEPNPKLRALWGDVRAKLGCDPRFEPDGLRLAKKDIEDPPTAFTTKGDVVPGFALIDSRNKPFWLGDGGAGSGKAVEVPGLDQPFYIARTLTTVAQYAQFVDSPDYASHFDGEGLQWLDGSYESKVAHDELKKWLAERPKEQRHQPHQWQGQLANPLRPIVYVSWFEAQAYLSWLNASLGQNGLERFNAALPTELQWECAARFDVDAAIAPQLFPWSGGPGKADADKEEFALFANLGGLVGNPTTVGLFPTGHTKNGLADVAGNVWEWLARSYSERDDLRVELGLKMAAESHSLRGGSWTHNADFARCSARCFFPPDSWSCYFGFRVVLSLAN